MSVWSEVELIDKKKSKFQTWIVLSFAGMLFKKTEGINICLTK